MRKYSFLIAVLMITIPGLGQHAQVTGIVKESLSKQTILAATITLKDPASKLLATVLTDNKGMFGFEKVTPGTLIITYSCKGFQTIHDTLQVSAGAVLNLGSIHLVPERKLLQEVSVTSEKTAVSLKLDKKVFEVGKDVLAQTGTVTDLLNIVPSVTVSPGGGISLRGSSNVLVLVNGRRTGLTQANALEQIPADQVERVEVINNPSSRYDAAGSAGIINIILKKNKKAGLTGQLRLVGGIPNETRISPSLNYKTNKLNLFGTIGLRLSDYAGEYTMEQATALSTTPTYLNRWQEEDRHDDGRLLYVGADYQPNTQNIFTTAFMRNATDDHDKTRLGFLYAGKSNATDSILTRTGESWEKRSYNQWEFNYTHTFTRPGKKFTVDMQYDFWNSSKDWNLATGKLYPDEVALPMISTRSAGASKDLLLRSDYIQPIDSNATLEFGLKMESRRVSSDFIAQQQNGNDWHVIEQIDNHLLYEELIGSGYVQFAGKMKKFSYQAGFRSEATRIGIEDRRGSYTNQKNYTRLFPTLNISYRFGTGGALQGSYSKRINRPQLYLIYPFNELTDLNTRFIGNPELNPSYGNVLELSLLRSWTSVTINPSIYYQHNSGAIEEYTYQNAAGLFITTPVNIATEVRRGIELSILYNPVKWLQLNTTANAYSFYQRGTYGIQNFDYSGNTLTARINTQVRLKKKWSLQALYNFRGNNATSLTRSAAVHVVNAGISKTFLKDKATMTLDVSNLFNLQKFSSNTTGIDYTIYKTDIPNPARYRLTFVYRLNVKENQAVRQARNANRN